MFRGTTFSNIPVINPCIYRYQPTILWPLQIPGLILGLITNLPPWIVSSHKDFVIYPSKSIQKILDKESHPEKCKVVRLSQGLMYKQRQYFSISNHQRIFTKVRLDTNCMLGSLRFRNNKIMNSTCICGEGEQKVEHVLLIVRIRKVYRYPNILKRDIVDM